MELFKFYEQYGKGLRSVFRENMVKAETLKKSLSVVSI